MIDVDLVDVVVVALLEFVFDFFDDGGLFFLIAR